MVGDSQMLVKGRMTGILWCAVKALVHSGGMELYKRTSSIRPAGVLATACTQWGTIRNTGSPSGDRSVDQLATRERPAGLTGMTERLVVCAEQHVVQEG
jgi:hypothetical protein